jgi:hydrogenase-1 operon protein HyaF
MRAEPVPGFAGLGGSPLAVEDVAGMRIDSGNVALLLEELRHALERRLTDGTTHVIDLRSLPLDPGDEERLFEALGTGQVHAEFDALGRSAIDETGYPGIWRVSHWNSAGELTGRFLEVTYTPALLSSPPEDVAVGLGRLTADLDG